ncbi:glycoside hydrolase family 3 C-terminal domain-containing protein [Aquabacterium sp. OR-4]|uniref:glycoside hydrolase family 3 C-terminal domain-containing protein n=1 Tax=Aquabacterium sp. OR-4 TaxID=2978127 RepID=UPI0028C5E3D3|nr:glycoside hydrolase family 3 C-terminal domain-containing protein [Aquabacterium sp. OR-4]MDT7837928.1 glycoside hydrolase family 3 C-terminal domain-containing protein [Aquabacterium sp. OR-4]
MSRVRQLLAQLSLGEKAGLMANANAAVPRLGLPAYDHWTEALHGLVAAGESAVVYPAPIALAAGFDAALLHTIGQQIATDGRRAHARALQRSPGGTGGTGMSEGLCFMAPNLNILRDPRWGRGQETLGEDPQLTAQLGVALIRGLQAGDQACAVAKHFAVHSGPEPLRFSFDAQVSAYDLSDTYLPAFRAAVVDGQVGGLMTVYNAVNGQPGAAHAGLVRDMARSAWGFQGFVMSDCNAVRFLHSRHQHVASEAEAVAAAVRSGMDTELYAGPVPAAAAYLDAVAAGLLTEAQLDTALARSLAVRERLGVLHAADAAAAAPGPAPSTGPGATPDAAHAEAALRAAQQGLVLLKNNGLLPLAPGIARIAVVGPLADDLESMLGNYHGQPTGGLTPLQALGQRFAQAEFIHARGANVPMTPQDLPTALLSSDDGQPGLSAQRHAGFGPAGEPVARWVDAQARWFGRAGQGFTRWTGWLTVPESGRWHLGSHGTGACRMWLDEQLLADDAHPHAPADCLAALDLVQGQRLRLRFEVMGMPMGFSRLVGYREAPGALQQAEAAMAQADLVLAFVGLNGRLEGEDLPVCLPGFEGGDRQTLALPAEQQLLLAAVRRSGKPWAAVLMAGGAVSDDGLDAADALLHAWYPGQAGGTAIAQVLAGDVNPGGRMPVTTYRELADLPPFESYAMAGRTYRYYRGRPRYPFGHGLSYTRFGYTDARLSCDTLQAGEPLSAEVSVRNLGQRDGDEVVQAYLAVPGSPGANPGLQAFQRIQLRAGAEQRVGFQLLARQLSQVAADGSRWVAEGRYTLHLGGGQPGTAAPGVALHFHIRGRQRLPD